MVNIKQAGKPQMYEIFDLWQRVETKSNSFISDNFWETHYDEVKKKYFTNSECFAYTSDDKIVGFVCISEKNNIAGVFVDPDFQNQGIGTALIEYAKTEYSMLNVNVYAKNREALKFAANRGFIIDGAVLNSDNDEIQYTMIWNE